MASDFDGTWTVRVVKQVIGVEKLLKSADIVSITDTAAEFEAAISVSANAQGVLQSAAGTLYWNQGGMDAVGVLKGNHPSGVPGATYSVWVIVGPTLNNVRPITFRIAKLPDDAASENSAGEWEGDDQP